MNEELKKYFFRMEEMRDLPSPIQRKRMEKREAEIRKRRDAIDFEDEVLKNFERPKFKDHSRQDYAFVSARTFPRQLLEAVMKRDEEKVKELMRDSR